ncbi:MAG: lysostaphin resistance A-like protein [Pirellula sp.]|jgi:membrane protease YdiL (CAAX protease family)
MQQNSPNHQQFFTAAMFELGIGLLAVVLASFGGVHPHETMPKITEYSRIGAGLSGGLAIGLVMVLMVHGLEVFRFRWIEDASEIAEKHLTVLLRGCSFWHLIALSLSAGVGEELLFRGWLQGTLVRELEVFGTVGVAFAIFLASLMFGIVHPLSRGYVAVATVLGVFLGVIAYWSQNVFMAIIGHTVYDAILMILFVRKIRYREQTT